MKEIRNITIWKKRVTIIDLIINTTMLGDL